MAAAAAAFLYCEEEFSSWSPCSVHVEQRHALITNRNIYASSSSSSSEYSICNNNHNIYDSPASSSTSASSPAAAPAIPSNSFILSSATTTSAVTTISSNSNDNNTTLSANNICYCTSSDPNAASCSLEQQQQQQQQQDNINFEDELQQLLHKEHLLPQSYTRLFQQLDARSHEDLFLARHTSILWMFQIRCSFNLQPHTVALAINYFDRYLSKNLDAQNWWTASTWMFKLLCISCLSIAAKMEDACLPINFSLEVAKCLGIQDSESIIRKMELLVLQNLEWRLLVVTPFSFVDLMLHELKLSKKLYLMLLDKVTTILIRVFLAREALGFLPSILAATSIYIALQDVAPLEINNFKFNIMAKTILQNNDVDTHLSYKMMIETLMK